MGFIAPFLMRIAPYALGAILILLIGTYVHNKICAQDMAEVQAQFDKHLAADQQEEAKRNAEARAKEQAWNEKFAAVDSQNQKAQNDLQTTYQHRLDDLRSGAMRVRDNRASVCNTVPASQAPASPGPSNGTATGQLSESDVQFLLSFSRRADEVVNQLSSCQEILKTERQ
jgi:hypothetical protein